MAQQFRLTEPEPEQAAISRQPYRVPAGYQPVWHRPARRSARLVPLWVSAAVAAAATATVVWLSQPAATLTEGMPELAVQQVPAPAAPVPATKGSLAVRAGYSAASAPHAVPEAVRADVAVATLATAAFDQQTEETLAAALLDTDQALMPRLEVEDQALLAYLADEPLISY